MSVLSRAAIWNRELMLYLLYYISHDGAGICVLGWGGGQGEGEHWDFTSGTGRHCDGAEWRPTQVK